MSGRQYKAGGRSCVVYNLLLSFVWRLSRMTLVQTLPQCAGISLPETRQAPNLIILKPALCGLFYLLHLLEKRDGNEK